MTFSEFFIRRPVTTVLLNLAIIVGGVLAWLHIPVAALPRFDTPTINVNASLAGASPESMAVSVALPMEKRFASIAGLTVMTSSNTLGSTSITLEFDPARSIDAAALDVQAAILQSLRSLPPNITTPSYRKVNPADAPILLLSMSSPALKLSEINEYAENLVSPTVSTVDGVAQVSIFGQKRYAVRVKVDPLKLNAMNLSYTDLANTMSKATSLTSLGTLDGPEQLLILQLNTQFKNAADFARMVIFSGNGGVVRLSDVALVEDSVQTLQSAASVNGEPAIVLAVFRQPDANTVKAVDDVLALLPRLSAQLPSSVAIRPLSDRSVSIREAMHDINVTLVLTIVLVILVIFLFLRRVVATLIPGLSLPVSLCGALALLYWGGNSLNNISMLGITLAVGLVVDDAIVVLENVVRHVEEGMTPFAAAIQGSSEITFTILSISLSLVAVLIPIFFMSGTTGLLFHEFAVAVGLSIAVSAFVSLTLVPMLCSRFLPAHQASSAHSEGKIGQWLEARFEGLLQGYLRGLDVVMAHKKTTLVFLAGSFALTAYLFMAIPKGYFPEEDIGQMRASIDANQDISYPAMLALTAQAAQIIRADPAVDTVVSSVGSGNSGNLFINLKPRWQRPPIRAVIARMNKNLAAVSGIKAFFRPTQNLNVGGRSSKSRYQYTLQGAHAETLGQAAQTLVKSMNAAPEFFANVNSDAQSNALFASVEIDYDQANLLGVNTAEIRTTLNNAFGESTVSTIYTAANSYSVILQAQDQNQSYESAINDLQVRSKSGTLVPFSAFAKVKRTAGASVINHQGQLQAVTVSFDTAPGVALNAATAKVEELARALPDTLIRSWSGDAATFTQSQSSQWILLLAALLVVYVLLGVLYESFIHPLTILAGLPSAAVGALICLWLFNLDLTIIASIGILMLIGIVKKNAIMMIDYALVAQREHGKPPREAIREACRLRFRPITMTTLAALVGALPIALGLGASAELRQPLGIAVVGGLLVSQAVTLFATPVIYLYLDRWAGKGVVRDDALLSPTKQ